MAAKRRHILQIFIHVALLAEQLVTEQAVDGKYSRTMREICANLLDRLFCDFPVVAQLQQGQDIRVVYQTAAGPRVPLNKQN